MRRDRFIPFLFLLPALGLLVAFRVYPMVSTLTESLFMHNLNVTMRKFVGLANFKRMLADPVLWQSLKVTLIFNLSIVPIQTTLSLILALIANQRVRGIAIFRSIFIIPIAISPVVSTTIWKLMLDKNAGVINGLLSLVDIARQDFFISKDQALWSIMLVSSWRGIPFLMLFWLAGLQEIPKVLLEQAAIDGANRWQSFFHVTLPLLKRVFAFIIVSGTILNLILFAPIWMITRGGPQMSTNLIMYETYRRGMVYGDLGGASAMLIILLVVVIIIVGVEFLFLRTEAD
jgi:ABC-type sugar transport system permease subunit